MNNSQPITISQAMQQFIAKSSHKDKLAAATILCAWQQLMPAVVLQRTEQAFVKQNKLLVKISSAPLRQELQNTKDLIRQRINAIAPACGIADIMFL